MPRHHEIERKFLVAHLPKGWKRHASVAIVQGYFPLATKQVEIRLRHIGNKHVITVKGGYGLHRTEVEMEIKAAQFRALWPLTRKAHVSKRRYRIPAGNTATIEMDVYRGHHRGLVTAEIEFDPAQASRAFQPPAWLGREITGRRDYANAVLATRQRLPRCSKPS